jgi:uncharacterized protein (DUF433 family)/DNA-binding transcriptional MerR regulator
VGSSAEQGTLLLGVGLYTAAEAERLVGVPARRIRRWLLGYNISHDGQRRRADPLWQAQLPRLGREVELGFRDLIELKFVDAFLSAGVSLQAIRRALAIARDLLGDSHPFSTARFRTDGRTVFLQVHEETGEHTLLDLSKRQYAFNRIIEPSFRDLDLEDGVAARWWPMSHTRDVVVDPERNFGQPIVARDGVPTRALADAVAAEGSAAKVAKLYGLPPRSVRDAVEFEHRLAA